MFEVNSDWTIAQKIKDLSFIRGLLADFEIITADVTGIEENNYLAKSRLEDAFKKLASF